MIYAFLFSLLIIANQIDAVGQLTNKQYPISNQSTSLVTPTLAAAGSFAAGWRYVGSPLESKIIKKLAIERSIIKNGITVLKVAMLGAAAYKVKDYTATCTHRRAWPLQAVASVKIMVNELAVLKSISFHTMTASIPDGRWKLKMEKLIAQYESFIKQALDQLNDVCFELCDEKTLEHIDALQSDLAGLQSREILLPCTYQALCEAACDDRPLCLQLAELKSKLPIGHYITKLGYGVNNACTEMFLTQKAIFNESIKHCKRLAALQTAWDMTRGGWAYVKYVVSEWISREDRN